MNLDLFTPAAAHDPGGKRRVPWQHGVKVTARFGGPNDCYRYELTEMWDTAPIVPTALFGMMNPSEACLDWSDPTLFKTGKFARRWGYGAQAIANAYAYRATDSRQLGQVDDPIGPENDAAWLAMAQHVITNGGIIVLGYGQPPGAALSRRGPALAVMLHEHGFPLHYLRAYKKDGVSPWHPLYLPDDSEPQRYTEEQIKKLQSLAA